MLLPDSIFCPTWNASGSDALAQNILFTCQCVGSSRISLRDKCETKSYSWLDVENAYYQFCES
uniref:Uncharacterized protein n=1 Tax=Romanomermis culicivorax TaxID=13658 RepID=A0A915KLD3_ROMCU